MQIYPERQLWLLLCAFCLGLAMGALYEGFVAVRILLGAHLPPPRMAPLYEKALPLVKRAVPMPHKRKRRLWRGTVIAVCDALYCLCFALSLILLLYDQNDGAWRLSVPLLAFLGLAAFRILLSRPLCLLSAYLAFALAATGIYLRALLVLPVKAFCRMALHCFLHPLRRACRVLHVKLLFRTSQSLCRSQLAAAAVGFSGKFGSKKGKEDHEITERENNSRAMGDPRAHRGDLRARIAHRRDALNGAQPIAKGKGRLGKGKGRA